ncbi:MAG: potassium/proton antiporter [Candidatus Hydrogenedentales bacterium]|jgi:cell volume regulation protein A
MPQPFVILFIAGFLVLISILASKISDRIGIPALIVFLCVGMLAGSDGPGGIHFDDTAAANLVGTLALAFILFSGGLDTNWRIIRPVLGRGITLATFGVVITAGLVGLFVWQALGLPVLMSLLIGAIISSTDAAAVFSVLRGRGVGLKGNLKPLLELESGSNDPMAIFLTVGLTQALTVPDFEWPYLMPLLVWNMALGAGIGLGVGKLAGFIFNRIRLDYEGLYPVLSLSLVLVTFGATEQFKGNGFLAVYLCGMMLNATDFAHKRSIAKFHDGLAWLMQIILFVVLGLLVFPAQLPSVALEALVVALFLMLVARPMAVYAGLLRSDFSLRERSLVAWTGLRGAVPIVLATYPYLAGYEHSATIFNMVFFTVLTSVMIQGTMLMRVARWLGVDEPLASRAKYSLEIERQGQAQGETREVEILPNMAVVGRSVADLDIPADVLILLIGRGEGFVVPRGQTRLEPYDTLLMIGDPSALRLAEKALLSPPSVPKTPEQPMDPLATLPLTTEQKFLSKQVVVVGYGRVGRRICRALAKQGIPYVVADRNRLLVEELRAQGVPAVSGDASTAMVLAQAHVARAAVLVVATPDTMKVRKMAEFARALNPGIEIVIRTHSEMEANLLQQEQAGKVFLGEQELAENMTDYVLCRVRGDAPAPEAG